MLTRATPMAASSGIGISSVFTPVTASIRFTESRPRISRTARSISARVRDAIEEHHVGAGIQIEVGAEDGLLQPEYGKGIGAGIDDDVGAQARRAIHHGPNLARHLFGGNHLLAFHVAAALGEDLVFDVDAGDAHFDQPFGDGGGIDGVAAAGIDIGHHGNRHGAHDVAGDVEDLFHVHQSDIRLAEQAPGKSEAADLDGLKPRAFDDFGAQRVMAPRHHQGFPALQGGAQNGSSIVH